ncbi:hypothetical protein, partial [Syntrophomonas wolfei]|uniref:hypothetical protein n=1 Tax=Syntrophomonas wolfei TaxID=863 RepID=UPI0023F35B11
AFRKVHDCRTACGKLVLVRYYGYYSNKSRGMRKKTETDVEMPSLVESDISKKAFRRKNQRAD